MIVRDVPLAEIIFPLLYVLPSSVNPLKLVQGNARRRAFDARTNRAALRVIPFAENRRADNRETQTGGQPRAD